MKYIGIDRQIRKNNTNSVLLLLAFPLLLIALSYALIFFADGKDFTQTNQRSVLLLPYLLTAVAIWFLIAWVGNTSFIRWATGSKPLLRIENKRVYNLLENLCIQEGIRQPTLYVIDDSSLNAFASGVKESNYSISLSRGIIEKLTDEELEGVIAHELSHIKNRDTRLLIVSILFVGIFSFLAEMAFRSLRFAGRKGDKGSKGSGTIILIAIVITALAYFISLLLRFGISRKREFMADASASEMTKKPYALASALRKIAVDPAIEAVESRDVAQLFIDNPTPSIHISASWDNMFSTHPKIEKRIELLEQFV